ncbi:hypothetical protein CXG81DRAFT_27034 [Caulochytrium protostelioides]|uniref:F-box domain-containing protein n=1 Tax=Caulochytrium protostelioides TaxID=1555241 RepID=A0A4P9X564_9FUNG|nr:hypothetical protein CXG81DRAFT_27034 [Caulochytrium protostelioides]|eukprot:RKP00244.1 hypothetical protein CXG81DRAFT_27034 [Caulochytrium protostelioides]
MVVPGRFVSLTAADHDPSPLIAPSQLPSVPPPPSPPSHVLPRHRPLGVSELASSLGVPVAREPPPPVGAAASHADADADRDRTRLVPASCAADPRRSALLRLDDMTALAMAAAAPVAASNAAAAPSTSAPPPASPPAKPSRLDRLPPEVVSHIMVDAFTSQLPATCRRYYALWRSRPVQRRHAVRRHPDLVALLHRSMSVFHPCEWGTDLLYRSKRGVIPRVLDGQPEVAAVVDALLNDAVRPLRRDPSWRTAVRADPVPWRSGAAPAPDFLRLWSDDPDDAVVAEHDAAAAAGERDGADAGDAAAPPADRRDPADETALAATARPPPPGPAAGAATASDPAASNSDEALWVDPSFRHQFVNMAMEAHLRVDASDMEPGGRMTTTRVLNWCAFHGFTSGLAVCFARQPWRRVALQSGTYFALAGMQPRTFAMLRAQAVRWAPQTAGGGGGSGRPALDANRAWPLTDRIIEIYLAILAKVARSRRGQLMPFHVVDCLQHIMRIPTRDASPPPSGSASSSPAARRVPPPPPASGPTPSPVPVPVSSAANESPSSTPPLSPMWRRAVCAFGWHPTCLAWLLEVEPRIDLNEIDFTLLQGCSAAWMAQWTRLVCSQALARPDARAIVFNVLPILVQSDKIRLDFATANALVRAEAELEPLRPRRDGFVRYPLAQWYVPK